MRLQATIAGSHDAPQPICALAKRIGALFASMDIVVVTGGRAGVMEHAARGAHSKGGTVLAILPGTDPADVIGPADAVVPTGMGHGRNHVNVLAGNMLVPLAGGAGTMSEICFALIHERPVFIIEGLGGASDGALHRPPDPRAQRLLVACEHVEELGERVRDWYNAHPAS